MEIFNRYNTLWQNDRDDEIKEFLSKEPRVSEFEAKIKYYESLSNDINSEAEFMSVPPLAIFTGKKRKTFRNDISIFSTECFLYC